MLVEHNGQKHELEIVTPSEVRETWTEVLLPDGRVLKLKPVLTLVGHIKGVLDDAGDPMIHFRVHMVHQVIK